MFLGTQADLPKDTFGPTALGAAPTEQGHHPRHTATDAAREGQSRGSQAGPSVQHLAEPPLKACAGKAGRGLVCTGALSVRGAEGGERTAAQPDGAGLCSAAWSPLPACSGPGGGGLPGQLRPRPVWRGWGDRPCVRAKQESECFSSAGAPRP